MLTYLYLCRHITKLQKQMNKNLLTTIGMILMTAMPATAQTNYDYSKLQREQLNRGVVAIRTEDGKVAVSWRTLMSDPKGQPYDVYRNGVKLNKKPLTTGGTFFIDEQPLQSDAVYEVRGGGNDGKWVLKADFPVGYIPIPIQKPEGR